MNWGNKLILIFLLFGGMIVYMVYRCMSTPVDLVAKEYYKDELAYQQVIDATRNANELAGQTNIRQTYESVIVQLPAAMRSQPVSGDIYFYCPSDQQRDRHIRLRSDTGATLHIPLNAVLKGHYLVKINWQSNGISYFAERKFTIE